MQISTYAYVNKSMDMLIINPMDFEEIEGSNTMLNHLNGWATLTFLLMSFFSNSLLDNNRH